MAYHFQVVILDFLNFSNVHRLAQLEDYSKRKQFWEGKTYYFCLYLVELQNYEIEYTILYEWNEDMFFNLAYFSFFSVKFYYFDLTANLKMVFDVICDKKFDGSFNSKYEQTNFPLKNAFLSFLIKVIKNIKSIKINWH